MSAPQPHVRVSRAPFSRQPVIWECDACGKNGFVMTDPGDSVIAYLHEKVCPATKLAALVARLETLRDRWRDHETHESSLVGYAERDACADDLHRVIEGARG